MANKGGVITRKDIIEDEALRFGEVYADNVKEAIDANMDFVKSIMGIADAFNKMKNSYSNAQYLAAKDQEKLATEKAMNAIRLQTAAELDAEKVRQAKIKTDKAAKDAEDKLNKSREKSVNLTTQERIELQLKNRDERENARLTSQKIGDYEKLNIRRVQAQRTLADLMAAEKNNTELIKQAQQEFERLDARVKAIDATVKIFNKNVGNYPTLKGYTAAVKDLFSAFGLVGGITVFASVIKDAFTIVREYEAEIVNLAAIAGQSRSQIKPLEDEIRNVAAASLNGATDVAKLATELIKLGSTPEEAAKLLKPVDDLSVALRASAEDSATLVKSVLNAYQMGAEQAGHVTDVLAESANRSALDFQGLRDSLGYLAPTAKTVGFSLEKTAAIIGILADNGIKAESAGRLMSTSLIRLSTSGMTLEQALGRISKLQQNNASELEILAEAGSLFGSEAAKLGIILSNNSDKIDENTKAYENSTGALAELTNKQLKSLDSQLKILSSAWEDYILDTNESSGASKTLTRAVEFLSNNLSELINFVLAGAAAWAAYKTVASAQKLVMELLTIRTNALAVAQGFLANGIKGARIAMEEMDAVAKRNVTALILTALVAVIATAVIAYNKLSKSLSELTTSTINSTDSFLKNRDVQEKNEKTLTDLVNRYEELSGKINRTTKEQKELDEITKILAKTVPNAATEMNKYGDVLKVSADKIKEYIKLQKEVRELETAKKLRENLSLLEKLQKEQKRLSLDSNNPLGGRTKIEGIGVVRREDNIIKTTDFWNPKGRRLNGDELLIFKNTILENNRSINIVEDQIRNLRKLQLEAKGISNNMNKPTEEKSKPRTIEIIEAEIKAEKDKISQLTYATRAQGEQIKARIKALEAEKEAIYSTADSEKDLEKARKERLDRLKNRISSEYELRKFYLDKNIAINEEFIKDEKQNLDEILNAFLENEQLKQALAEETFRKEMMDMAIADATEKKYSLEKIKNLEKETNKRIDSLIKTGEATSNLNNQEKLSLEKLNAVREENDRKRKKLQQEIIDSEVDKIKKATEEKVKIIETESDKAIASEILMYNATKSINGKKEKETEEFERRIFEIKKEYAKKALKEQIDSIESYLNAQSKLPENERASNSKIVELNKQLYELKKQLGEKDLENWEKVNGQILLSEEQKQEKLREMTYDLKDALGDVINSLFERNISNIDAEIQANDEYYQRQIELAGEDSRQKELLQKEQEKKRKELEDKKRKEEIKQAIFEKGMSVMKITISTAEAIMKGYAQLGPIGGAIATGLVTALGLAQIISVLSAPLPKYKDGRKGGQNEMAIVGDGGVQEVIKRNTGKVEMTPNTDTLIKLYAGDKVYSSADEYNKIHRAAMMAGLESENRKLNNFQTAMAFDYSYEKVMIEELKLTRRAVEKNKGNVYVSNKIDMGHNFWNFNQNGWKNGNS